MNTLYQNTNKYIQIDLAFIYYKISSETLFDWSYLHEVMAMIKQLCEAVFAFPCVELI